MSTCRVGGCGGPVSRDRFCERHRALWRMSLEAQRADAIYGGSKDRARAMVALVDFARRIEAEERNGGKG